MTATEKPVDASTTALRRAVIDQPASEARYYTGLVVILLSWLSAYIYAYSPTLMPGAMRASTFSPPWIWRSSSASFSWREFWEKVRRIFVYEDRI